MSRREDWTRPRLREHLAGALAVEIVSGRLAEGERLPSARELTESFEVSRTVVREAIQMLASVDLVRVQQGRHTVVLPEASWDALSPLVVRAFFDAGRGAEVEEALEDLRLAIEPVAVAGFAARATAEDVAALQRINRELADLAAVGGDLREFLERDREFHNTILRGCGNPLLASVHRHVAAVMEIPFVMPRPDPAEMQTVAQQHGQIAAAVAGRDGATASEAMRRHIVWATAIDRMSLDHREELGTDQSKSPAAIPAARSETRPARGGEDA